MCVLCRRGAGRGWRCRLLYLKIYWIFNYCDCDWGSFSISLLESLFGYFILYHIQHGCIRDQTEPGPRHDRNQRYVERYNKSNPTWVYYKYRVKMYLQLSCQPICDREMRPYSYLNTPSYWMSKRQNANV